MKKKVEKEYNYRVIHFEPIVYSIIEEMAIMKGLKIKDYIYSLVIKDSTIDKKLNDTNEQSR